jgi:hypothetical protein
MTNTSLAELASKIPNMGAARIGAELTHEAFMAPKGSAIVEVGVWLGCGTAYLSIGAIDKVVHCYDHFIANASEIEKADKFGVALKSKQSTLDIVKNNLQPFSGNIVFHQGDIKSIRWSGAPIGLYVDDASKTKDKWDHVAREFFPHILVGAKIILMDYWYFRTTKQEKHKAQFNFMQAHTEYFKYLMDLDTNVALFEVIKKYENHR